MLQTLPILDDASIHRVVVIHDGPLIIDVVAHRPSLLTRRFHSDVFLDGHNIWDDGLWIVVTSISDLTEAGTIVDHNWSRVFH